jgi:hypothetical protein
VKIKKEKVRSSKNFVEEEYGLISFPSIACDGGDANADLSASGWGG